MGTRNETPLTKMTGLRGVFQEMETWPPPGAGVGSKASRLVQGACSYLCSCWDRPVPTEKSCERKRNLLRKGKRNTVTVVLTVSTDLSPSAQYLNPRRPSRAVASSLRPGDEVPNTAVRTQLPLPGPATCFSGNLLTRFTDSQGSAYSLYPTLQDTEGGRSSGLGENRRLNCGSGRRPEAFWRNYPHGSCLFFVVRPFLPKHFLLHF